MRSEYQALLEKVASFTEPMRVRQAAEMACRAGCDGCCHAWLAPSPVEADALHEALARLPQTTRRAVAARGRLQREREVRAESPARCALLDDDGRCAAYEARPLVCRTQGHALRYPQGVIPATAIRKRVPGGEVAACELNFTREMPPAIDTLDAERIDLLLGVVNARYCEMQGKDPHRRRAISEIAAECNVLGFNEIDDDRAPARSACDDDVG